MNRLPEKNGEMAMTGWIVKMKSQNRAFAMIPVYYDHLRLPRNAIVLHLIEMNPEDVFKRKDGIEFSIALDTKTWKEIDRFDRPDDIDDIIREFIEGFHPDLKALLPDKIKYFTDKRNTQSALEENTLDHKKIVDSDLISYQLLKRFGCNEGPFAFSLRFVVDKHVVYVEDFYCSNPDCTCNEVVLSFMIERWDRETNQAILDQRFNVRMGFDGKWTDIKWMGASKPDTAKYLNAMCQYYPRIEKVFQFRYHQIRSLAINILQSHFAGKNPTMIMPDTKKPRPKIGRNDPCPCGSGKKYKKCCL